MIVFLRLVSLRLVSQIRPIIHKYCWHGRREQHSILCESKIATKLDNQCSGGSAFLLGSVQFKLLFFALYTNAKCYFPPRVRLFLTFGFVIIIFPVVFAIECSTLQSTIRCITFFDTSAHGERILYGIQQRGHTTYQWTVSEIKLTIRANGV